ncbi:MAG: hypothetical protein IPK63_13825 [Candidatus Competibacteraceae bacterium]|nr:hypothetical protein [Candidatus Competibacteraceae bacterium]
MQIALDGLFLKSGAVKIEKHQAVYFTEQDEKMPNNRSVTGHRYAWMLGDLAA